MIAKLLIAALSVVAVGCSSTGGVSNFDKYHKNNDKLSGAHRYSCINPEAAGYSTDEAMSRGVLRCRGE